MMMSPYPVDNVYCPVKMKPRQPHAILIYEFVSPVSLSFCEPLLRPQGILNDIRNSLSS